MQSTNPKDKIGRTKPGLDLIPPAALIEEAVVMGLGAKKYGPYNWRSTSVSSRVYIAACLRHVLSWLDGENFDKESGASHLAHARACLGILLDALANGTAIDDRPPAGKAAELIAKHTKATSEVALGSDGSGGTMTQTPPYKPRAYIAGPMRGYPKYNFPAFDVIRDELHLAGFEVESPADIDRAAGVDEDFPADKITPSMILEFARRDCDAIFSCTHIAMLPGWEKSVGATAEFFLARWLGLVVFDARTGERLNHQDVNTAELLDSLRKFLIGQSNIFKQ